MENDRVLLNSRAFVTEHIRDDGKAVYILASSEDSEKPLSKLDMGQLLACFTEMLMRRNNEAVKVAMRCVEKQIPKKPFGKNRFSGMRCLCGRPVYMHMLYCDNCGQQLDWSQYEQS